MARFSGLVLAGVLVASGVLCGCRSGTSEYYRELSDEQRAELEKSAKLLVLQSQAVPERLRGVFEEIPGNERIIYTGDCRGRAEYRWEIYENSETTRIRQKDVNPFWIRVYAEGDLLNPQWKMAHSDFAAKPAAGAAGGTPSPGRTSGAPRPQGDSVRYRQ